MRIQNLTTVAGGNTKDTIGPKVMPVTDIAHPEGQETIKLKQNEVYFQNDQKRLKESVEQANKAIEGSGRHFKYEIHKPTNQVVISVMDNNTNEVITEIPARKLLDVVSKLMELAGLIVDERR